MRVSCSAVRVTLRALPLVSLATIGCALTSPADDLPGGTFAESPADGFGVPPEQAAEIAASTVNRNESEWRALIDAVCAEVERCMDVLVLVMDFSARQIV